jgi:hypothetical protein
MRLQDVENPHLEVAKHADLYCMAYVGLRKVTCNTGNMTKHVEFSVKMVRQEFGIGCLGVGIAKRSI